jgi:phosphatidylglycerol:prolipoprotein diacylglycerol transferase
MYRFIDGISTYAIVYRIGIITNMVLAIWLCRRRRVTVFAGIALGVSYAFAMTMGARILYDILHSRVNLLNYFDPSFYMKPLGWGGPLVYLAMAITGVLVMARDKKEMTDVVALTLPVPMMLAKVACFLNGCCYGAPCDLPWAVTFPEGAGLFTAPPGISRHPTQLYEIIVLLIIQMVFFVLSRERWKVTLIIWFLALYGIGRSFTEFFRAPEIRIPVVGPLSSSQTVLLSAAAIAIVVLILIANRRAADGGIGRSTGKS